MNVIVASVFCLHSLFLFFLRCQATHFRGAQFWFRPLAAANQIYYNTLDAACLWQSQPKVETKMPPFGLTVVKAEINFRVTWRMSYSETTVCNRSLVASGALIGPETPGYLLCNVGCRGRVGDVSIRCTDYSVLDNWMTGVRTYNWTAPSTSGIYELEWDGTGWFKDDVPWMLRMRMNLRIRNSTGKVNSSPRAIMSPYPINLQQGCSASIRINVTDDDGDVVRCRWAESIRQECGGVCHDSFDVGRLLVTLDQGKCSLLLNESIAPDDYVIAIQLEDFDRLDGLFQNPLSSVPLQFSISIFNSSANSSSSSSNSSQSNTTAGANPGANPGAVPTWCQVGPVFVPPTPDNGSCWSMRQHGYNNNNSSNNSSNSSIIIIAATTKDSVTRVSRINAFGPANVSFYVTDVALNDSDVVYYVITNVTSDSYVAEGKQFCFQAVDNFGFSSKLLCFRISFDLDPPKAISATYDSTTKRIIVTFNQQIMRPLDRRLVTAVDIEGGNQVAAYDTSVADQVTFEPTVITMAPTNQMLALVFRCFYLVLEEGAVLNQCSTPNARVFNATALNFTTSLSGPNGCNVFASTTTTTKATTTTTPKAVVTSSQPTSAGPTTITPNSHPSNASSVDSSGGSSSEAWNYRWLIVAVVCSVVLFALVVLVAALFARRRHSRSNDLRLRQERFFNTLSSRGIYNWAYDQQRSKGSSAGTTTEETTTTTETTDATDATQAVVS